MAPKPSTVPMRVSVAMMGSGTPAADEELGLLDVGEVGRARCRAGRRGASVPKVGPVLGLPGLDGRHPVAGAGRDVGAVVVEAAVAAHAVGDERLGEVVVGEQLGLGVGQLLGRIPFVVGHQLYTHLYTPASSHPPVAAPSARPSSCGPPRRRRSPAPASPAPRWTTWPPRPASPTDRLPALRLEGGAVPGGADRGPDRLREEFVAGFERRAEEPGLRRPRDADGGPRGPRRLPPAVAPRRPRAAVRRLRRRLPRPGRRRRRRPGGELLPDPDLRRWATVLSVDFVVQAVLGWMDHGDPARDDELERRVIEGLVALYPTWQ